MIDEKVHLRHIMLYEFRKGVSVGAAQKNISEVYGDRGPALRTIKKWFGRFRLGDFNLEDQPRSGRPSDIDNDIFCTLVEENPKITTEEIAQRLKIDNSTAFRHLKKLGYISKLETWVPHLLTVENKLNRMNVAISLLARQNEEPFLNRLVTGDEKWILYNNVRRKRTWKKAGESANPIAKAGMHPMKVLLCVWWDCRGIIHFELLRRGETITADKYCEQLTRLNAAIREKRPVLANRKGIIFHHDNARPHVAQQTLRKLHELRWECLQHPPYSPDIAPTDYHLFRSLQNSLAGKCLQSEEDVLRHLTIFFDEKSADFFSNGINKLVDRWKTIVDNNGEYIID